MKRLAAFVYLFAVLGVCLISATARAEEWEARDWPKADRLFHSDPRWLGADAAFSIPLDGERVLWLFGDTFIGDGKVKRAKSEFIRTSIGVQRGLDPTHAHIDFYWHKKDGAAASYFSANDDTWLWPLHGIYRNNTLTLFFMHVTGTDTGFRFKLTGSAALRCDNPQDSPADWTFHGDEMLQPPRGLHLLFGVAVLEEDDHILAYCFDDKTRGVVLLRWAVADFDRGDLTSPEWWDGKRYATQDALTRLPAIVMPDAATEFSVQRLPDGHYIQVQSVGFGATDIGIRTAPRPEGPWSDPKIVYRPKESKKEGANVYAAKAHPQLEGAHVLVTYAANTFDPKALLRNKTLYYPRFVRIDPSGAK